MTTLILLAILASEAPAATVTEDAKRKLECLERAGEAATDRYRACGDTQDIIRCMNESTEIHLAAVDSYYALDDEIDAGEREPTD